MRPSRSLTAIAYDAGAGRSAARDLRNGLKRTAAAANTQKSGHFETPQQEIHRLAGGR
jgi:hypothetical protein